MIVVDDCTSFAEAMEALSNGSTMMIMRSDSLMVVMAFCFFFAPNSLPSLIPGVSNTFTGPNL